MTIRTQAFAFALCAGLAWSPAHAFNLGDVFAGGAEKKAQVEKEADADFWKTYRTQVLQGTAAGVIAGAIIGRLIGGRDGAVVGAVAGGAIGNAIGRHYAELTKETVVTQKNAKNIIAENNKIIADKRDMLATLAPAVDTLEDQVRSLTADYKSGKASQQTYATKLNEVKKNIQALDADATALNDVIAAIKTQIQTAQKNTPEAVPALSDQLEDVESAQQTIEYTKAYMNDLILAST